MAISVEEARAMTEEQLQETITEIAFEIIANVGTARGMYIEAIQEAKAGHFDQAEQLMKDGKEAFVQGHHGHAAAVLVRAHDLQLHFLKQSQISGVIFGLRPVALSAFRAVDAVQAHFDRPFLGQQGQGIAVGHGNNLALAPEKRP